MKLNGFISFSISDEFNIIIKSGKYKNHDTYDCYLEHKDYDFVKHCYGVCQKDVKLFDFIKVCYDMMWCSYIEDYYDTLEKLESEDTDDED